MSCKNPLTNRYMAGAVLGAILAAAIISGCTAGTGPGDSGDSDRSTASPASSEREGGHSGDEHGGGEGSGGDGQHGSGSEGGQESREAAMSSPITPLEQGWSGVLGGLAVTMQYDPATRSVHGTVRNTLASTLCYVQAEPHLKSGTKTVGELGPDKLGHLSPGQEVTSSLTVASEPKLAGVSFDGYVVHMEVFDCDGPGPAAHAGGEGTEGGGEHGAGGEEGGDAGGEEGGGAGGEEGGDAGGEEGGGAGGEEGGDAGGEEGGDAGGEEGGDAGGEEGGDAGGDAGGEEGGGAGGEEGGGAGGEEGGEGSGEHGAGGEEGSGANALGLDETHDEVRSGARLILKYDAPGNSFNGTVENTTNGVLERVRVEVHLSNGTELGPTTPTDMAPGEVLSINLPATSASFAGWTAHAEVGGGGSEGNESGGERRDGGEHGNGGESGGEHGSGSERSGGD